MYQITKQKVANIITSLWSESIPDVELECTNGIPYWKNHRFLSFDDSFLKHTVIDIFRLITEIYGTKIHGYDLYINKLVNKTNITYPDTYTDHNNLINFLILDVLHVPKHWTDTNMTRHIFTINDCKMYEVIDGELYRTLLWYLMDPLAFIAHVMLKHNIPPKVIPFFETVKRNIIIPETHCRTVYWLLRYILNDTLVLDIVDTILNIYIHLSIEQTNKLVEHTKKELLQKIEI